MRPIGSRATMHWHCQHHCPNVPNPFHGASVARFAAACCPKKVSAMRRHKRFAFLPTGKSTGAGGSEYGKPGYCDCVPGGDEKRGVVRALGGVERSRDAARQ